MKLFERNLIKNQKGQTLLIFLMVMGLALAAGVAISSRSIQSLKQQAYTGSSTESFFAAEAGVEDGLKRLEDPAFPATFTSDHDLDGNMDSDFINLDINGDGVADDVEYIINVVGGEYEKEMQQDVTEQIDLSADDDGDGLTDIETAKIFFDGASSGDEPIVTYFIVQKSSGTVSILEKGLIDPNESDGCNAGSSKPELSSDLGPAEGYDHVFKLPYSIAAFPTLNLGAGDKLILRVRIMCNNSTDKVLIRGYDSGGIPVTLPAQFYKIASTGTIGDTIRKIEATKTLPALPTIFDFVLFSASPTKQLIK